MLCNDNIKTLYVLVHQPHCIKLSRKYLNIGRCLFAKTELLSSKIYHHSHKIIKYITSKVRCINIYTYLSECTARLAFCCFAFVHHTLSPAIYKIKYKTGNAKPAVSIRFSKNDVTQMYKMCIISMYVHGFSECYLIL